MAKDTEQPISDPNPDGTPDNSAVRIGPDRLPEAIKALVRGDKAAARRFLDYAEASELPLDLIWSLVTPKGNIEATVLVTPSAGRTAMVFASRPPADDRIADMGQLIRTAVDGLRDQPITLAQALLDPGARDEHRIFEAGGFNRLAQLDYLERPIPRFKTITSPTLDEDVTIEAWNPEERKKMISLLESTYKDTLDCPGLTSMRSTNDILEGHIASGVFTPKWWHVLHVDGKPEGVALFNRSSDGNTIELVYLGISREIRGRGLGKILLTHGLSALDGESGRAIVLAVDRENSPAIHLYRRLGFRVSVKRVAYVRQVPI